MIKGHVQVIVPSQWLKFKSKLTNLLQQSYIIIPKANYLKCSLKYLSIDMEFGNYSKHATKITFALICEFMIAKWVPHSTHKY